MDTQASPEDKADEQYSPARHSPRHHREISGRQESRKEGRAAPNSLQSSDEPLPERDSHHLQDQQASDDAHRPPHLRHHLSLARRQPKKRIEDARPRQCQDDRTLRPRPRLFHPPRHECHPRNPQPRLPDCSRRSGVEL